MSSHFLCSFYVVLLQTNTIILWNKKYAILHFKTITAPLYAKGRWCDTRNNVLYYHIFISSGNSSIFFGLTEVWWLWYFVNICNDCIWNSVHAFFLIITKEACLLAVNGFKYLRENSVHIRMWNIRGKYFVHCIWHT